MYEAGQQQALAFDVATWPDCANIIAAIADVRAEEACRGKPVRWLGDHGRGSLGVAGHGYSPGSVISDPAHLAALGAARLAQLVSSGQAELVVPSEQ